MVTDMKIGVDVDIDTDMDMYRYGYMPRMCFFCLFFECVCVCARG